MQSRRSDLALITCLLFGVACMACGGGGGGSAVGTGAPPAAPGACGAVATIEDGRVPAREVHVAETGDDQTGNGTAGAPYASVARALQGITPGTAVRIHPGTYTGTVWVTGVAGTAADPIWIGGVPGQQRPTLVGGSEAMHLSTVRYLVLHDLEITSAPANGINCDDGGNRSDPDATRHLLFRDLWFHDLGAGGNNDGLKLSGVDDYVVRDCVFERISAGSGIDHVGCHGGLIVDCRFETMGSNAIQVKGGSADIEIRACTFEDAGQRGINIGGSTGFDFFRPPLSATQPNTEARNVRVYANRFGSCGTPFAFVGAVDCIAANNTIYGGTHTWLFRILQETTTSGGFAFLETQDCEVSNNLFHFDEGALSTYVNIGGNTQAGTFVIRNNLWYAHDDPSRSTPTLPVPEADGVYGADPFAGNPGAAPVPAASGPADGAGVVIPGLTGDLAGRCYASPPAIGAHEAP
ncbi:MAG: right-handed parallel beta-helix repeat-containing protein [Planctomycetota bacterium]|nr:right-handed parallel beta-helix repeat-containing protein [Planctomycetota bacterium]